MHKKTFPDNQFWSREHRKLHFRESNKISQGQGSMPLVCPPVVDSGTQHSRLHVARKVQVCQLNLCIQYFQMLPKTLHMTYKLSNKN